MIKHVLKDGRKVDSIAGTVIRQQDFEHVYEVIKNINRRYEGATNEYGEDNSGRVCTIT